MREEHLELKLQRRRTLGDRILERMHVIVAVAALIGLIAYAGGWWLAPREAERALEDVQQARADLTARAEAATFPAEARIAAVDAELKRAEGLMAPSREPAADLPRALTYPESYLATLKPGASNEVKFAPPASLRATPDVGGVDLAWNDAAGNNVKIKSFEILRGQGEAEPQLVGTVAGDVFDWKDRTASPGVAYAYRVRAVTEPSGAGIPERTGLSEPAQGKAISDFKIELVGENGKSARFKVLKWTDGSWRDRIYEVSEGGAIGGKDEALGVDFSTGRRLAKLSTVTRVEPRTRDEVVFEVDGRVVVESGGPKRVRTTGEEKITVLEAEIDGGDAPPEKITLERR
jgi:hypothetical protein